MGEGAEAVAEIDHALGTFKHKGGCLFASYGERSVGDAVLHPVLGALSERDAVVFIHPALHPSSRTLALPWPGFMMEHVFDTTRAAARRMQRRMDEHDCVALVERRE